jgi:hypothetical protein
MSIKITSGQIIKDVRLLEVDNIKIDNNTISSTNINGDVILEPNGTGNVTVASGNFVLPSNSSIFVGDNLLSLDDTLAEDIKSSYTIGALNAGNTLTSGSNLTTILKSLLQTVFFPNLSNPSGTLSARTTAPATPIGSSTTKVEVGTSANVTLTAGFNQGQILGANNASGVWQSGVEQAKRAGTAHSHVIDGTNVFSSTSRVISNFTIQPTNSWSGTIHHLAGPQPKDSSGANYLSPLSAGSVNISTGTTQGSGSTGSIIGVRAFFYAAYTESDAPPASFATSSDVRSLTSNISWSSPTNGQTLALSIPNGTIMVVFAYPDNLRNLTSVIDSGTGYNIVGVFGQYSAPGVLTSTDPDIVSVEGASNFTSINYKVFIYIPVGPIDVQGTLTYTFTI